MLFFARTRIRASRYARTLSSLTPKEPFEVLFLGRDEFSCLVLQQLYAAKDVWQSLSVATQSDHRTGRRGTNISVSPLKLLSQQLDLPVHEIPAAKSEFKGWRPPEPFYPLTETEVPSHHLLITASFGRILSNYHLKLFAPSRRLNVHPSLLPAYRGSAPIQHALIHGETLSGVCITEMLNWKAGIDCGDIWAERKIPVPESASFSDFRDISGKEGGELLVATLREMLSGKAVATPQKDSVNVRKAPMISFDDTLVDPTAQTAHEISRRHRALERPLVVRFRREREADEEILVQLHETCVMDADQLKSKPELGLALYDNRSKCLVVGCQSDTYLGVGSVKQDSKKLLAAKEWWNGAKPFTFY